MMQRLFSVLRMTLPGLMLVLAVLACSLPGASAPEAVGGEQTFEGAPVVRISSPLPNSTFLQGTTVNIMARIENAGPDVSNVEVTLNGDVVGQVEQPNPAGAAAFTITQSWPATVAGEYQVGVKAIRTSGEASPEALVAVNIIESGGDGSTVNTTSNTTTENTNAVDSTTVETGETDSTESMTENTGSGGGIADRGNRPSLLDGLSALLSARGSGGQTAPDTTENTVDEQPVPEQVVDNPPPAEQPQDEAPPPAPTDVPPPTAVPATPTPSVPTARLISGANVRTGPSTSFEPPLGALPANHEAEILAVNPAGDWYKIRYYNAEGWIFSQLVDISGNTSNLPRDAGPPTPLPATATPVPSATPEPAQVNIEVVNIQTAPHPLTCNQASEIQITIRNSGSQPTSSGGEIEVSAILLSSGATLESTRTVFPVLAAGEQRTVSAFLTVAVNHSEAQRITVRADANNQIAESNENDNTRNDAEYILQKGGCP